jgi:hypothetical protein
VGHTCNPSTWEAKAGGVQVQEQHELNSKTLSQKKKNKNPKLTNQTTTNENKTKTKKNKDPVERKGSDSQVRDGVTGNYLGAT